MDRLTFKDATGKWVVSSNKFDNWFENKLPIHLSGEVVNRLAELENTIENNMKCQDCGKECFEEKYPKVIFKDECHCICEVCSINYYKNTTGKIKLKEINH